MRLPHFRAQKWQQYPELTFKLRNEPNGFERRFILNLHHTCV